jgi:hypothetical protein
MALGRRWETRRQSMQMKRLKLEKIFDQSCWSRNHGMGTRSSYRSKNTRRRLGRRLATPEVSRISIKGGAKRPMVLIPSEDHSHVILLNQDLDLSGLTEIRASPRCRYMPRAFRGVVEHLSDNLASDSSVGAGVDLHDVRDPILI